MSKVFEDYFSEIQADMVAVCFEYVDGKAEELFIYCSNENDTMSVSYFYKINNMILERHEINKEVSSIDVSIDRQEKVMSILLSDLQRLEDLCKEYSKDVPTEIKIRYNIPKNSLEAKYSYDILYSNSEEKSTEDIEQEWINKLKEEVI